MMVKTYKEITRPHVIRNDMYEIFIMPDPNNNSNETYEFFRHSVSFSLQKDINYVYTLKS